jgi:hypothetical protein
METQIMNIRRLAGTTGLLAAFVIASAAIVFDPETGTGFVGKGDVQRAYGWNNRQLQDNASGLTFTYEDEVEMMVPCMKENSAQILYHTFKRERGVNAQIAYEARRNGQGSITGFHLTGMSGSGSIQMENRGCPGGWEPDPSLSPQVVGESAGGGLFAHHNGNTVVLENAPRP